MTGILAKSSGSSAAGLNSLATAENDFLVGAPTPFGSWVKKTVAEVKTILGLGSAAYTASGAYDVAGAAAGIIAASISDGDTMHTPSCDAVFDALAGKAPLSSPTLTGTPAAPTAADNTSTNQLATTAFAKSQDAVLARLPDQAINMTAAASGSSGITVADNDNVDFGTGNFTLAWIGSLPDWTPSSAPTWLLTKIQDGDNRWGCYINTTTGCIGYVHAKTGGATVSKLSTISLLHADNTAHCIVMVVTRETASVAGSITIYDDALLVEAISIAAGTPANISNTGSLAIFGYLDVRFAGTCSFAATYNRALTAAEVLDLYRNGVAFADKWGSQAELIAATNDRTFAGANNWANGNFNAFNASIDLSITANAAYQYCYLPDTYAPMTHQGKKYRLSFNAANIVGLFSIYDVVTATLIFPAGSFTSGTNVIEFTNLGVTGGIRLRAESSNSAGDFDNFSLIEIGATLALEPEGIQNNLWYDSSSNALNASYPTTGWSLTRRLNWATLPTGANNAAAAAAGVLVGGLYRTNADPSVLCTRTA